MDKRKKTRHIEKTGFDLGKVQELTIVRFKEAGVYLARDDDRDGEAVLLPGKEADKEWQVGDRINVFIYRDSMDRVIATLKKPLITIGSPAPLKVKELSKLGAFMDWGLERDLFLPYGEMEGRINEGDEILVRLYIDKSDRLACSMKDLWKYLSTSSPYKKGDEVTGRVYELGHDFGTFVAVDDKYSGMIPRFEKGMTYHIGDQIKCKVINIKEDGKLDLTTRDKAPLQLEEDGQLILDLIDSYAGALPFTEKADPEVILRETGLSKNAFKRAVGHLYKERKITLKDGHIRKA